MTQSQKIAAGVLMSVSLGLSALSAHAHPGGTGGTGSGMMRGAGQHQEKGAAGHAARMGQGHQGSHGHAQHGASGAGQAGCPMAAHRAADTTHSH